MPRLGALMPTVGGYIENDSSLGEPDWSDFDRNPYLLVTILRERELLNEDLRFSVFWGASEQSARKAWRSQKRDRVIPSFAVVETLTRGSPLRRR
jgi:hypothetical protein